MCYQNINLSSRYAWCTMTIAQRRQPAHARPHLLAGLFYSAHSAARICNLLCLGAVASCLALYHYFLMPRASTRGRSAANVAYGGGVTTVCRSDVARIVTATRLHSEYRRRKEGDSRLFGVLQACSVLIILHIGQHQQPGLHGTYGGVPTAANRSTSDGDRRHQRAAWRRGAISTAKYFALPPHTRALRHCAAPLRTPAAHCLHLHARSVSSTGAGAWRAARTGEQARATRSGAAARTENGQA